MAFSLCLFRNIPLPLIAVLVPVLLIFSCFLGFGFSLSIFLTSSVLILSTVYFTFSKQNPVLLVVEETEKEEILIRSQTETITQNKELAQEGAQMEEIVSKPQPENGTITMKKEDAQQSGIGQIHKYSVRSSDSLSESESIDQSSSSEESEVDWPFQGNLGQSSACSDGSISDEDSLIEIDLPNGNYVSSKAEDLKFDLQAQKLPDFSPTESMFRQQHSLMELLADFNEMNEEENLIEIDISMGSIKCSRFEIEA